MTTRDIQQIVKEQLYGVNVSPTLVVEAEHELESFAAKWDAKYPTISRQ